MALREVGEGPLKITRAVIDAAWRRRDRNTRIVIRDIECRGLSLVVTAGTMSWVFSFKPRGKDPATGRRWAGRTLTLGSPAALAPDAARMAASA